MDAYADNIVYSVSNTDGITFDFEIQFTDFPISVVKWWITDLNEVREGAFGASGQVEFTNDYAGLYGPITSAKGQPFDYRLNAPYSANYQSATSATFTTLNSSTSGYPGNGASITFKTNQDKTIYSGTLGNGVVTNISPALSQIQLAFIELISSLPPTPTPTPTPSGNQITIINGARSWMDLTNSQTSLVGQFLQITANGVQAAPMVQDQVDYSALANFSGNNAGQYLKLSATGVVAAVNPFFSYSHYPSMGSISYEPGEPLTLSEVQTNFAGCRYAGTVATGITLIDNTVVIITPGLYAVKASIQNQNFQFVINDPTLAYEFPTDTRYFTLVAGDVIWFQCTALTDSTYAHVSITLVA